MAAGGGCGGSQVVEGLPNARVGIAGVHATVLTQGDHKMLYTTGEQGHPAPEFMVPLSTSVMMAGTTDKVGQHKNLVPLA